MKKIVAGMLASAVAALFFVSATPACSSSLDCAKASKCSADPASSDAEKKSCEELKAGKCSSEYAAVQSCYESKQTCGTDNKTNNGDKLAGLCATEVGEAVKCELANPKADAGK